MTSSRISTVVALLLGAWLLAWLAHVLVQANQGSDGTVHAARGYESTVDLFLAHGWLQYDAAREDIVTNFPPGSPMDRFFRTSHLQEDVAFFNSGKRFVFRVENGQILNIDRNLHNILLPFATLRPWPGLLTFRPQQELRGELRGPRQVIELTGPTTSISDNHDIPSMTVRAQGEPGAEERVQAEAVSLVGDDIVFGKTHLVGRSILFNNRGMTGAGTRISISGEPVLQGNRARMDSGDVLKLQWRRANGDSRYAVFWSTILPEAPIVSAYAAINGRWQRTPELPQPALAQDIVESLDAACQRREAGGADPAAGDPRRRQFDLALTLDSDLESQVQRYLETYSRSLRGTDEPPFRAAVTIMDATTGELLALASYPTEADLNGFKGSAEARDRLLRNHNFSRLPVGSVAKVIFSAAILDQAPFLADLKIRGYSEGRIDNILGIEIKPPLADHPVDGGADHLIDFDEFIEHSSNKYAATLLTLATAVDGRHPGALLPPGTTLLPDRLAPADRFYLGDVLYDRRPAMALPIAAGPIPGSAVCHPISTLEYLAFADRLTHLFGVPISRKTLTADSGKPWRHAPGEGDDLTDTSLWMPLLVYLYGSDSIPINHPFFRAAPERENLAFNLIKDYRGQFLAMILGGASSTWTNPQLCRIFSSLVTGKRLETSLVKRIKPWQEAAIETDDPARSVFDIGSTARERLLAAMTRVAGPDGTASLLNPLLLTIDEQLRAKGKTLGFFSKTGSPADLIAVQPATVRAVNELIKRHALHLGPDGFIHYRDTGPVQAELPEDDESASSVERLQQNAGDMAVLRRIRVSPRLVVRACGSWNRSRPEDRTLFKVERGQLVSMRTAATVESTGGAYVFTMGIYDQAARRSGIGPRYLPLIDPALPPERALTVAISIQGQGNSTKTAVPFAKKLIHDVVWPAIEKGW